MDGAEQLHRAALRPGYPVEPGLDFERLERREKGIEQDFLVDDSDRHLGVARVLINIEAPDRGLAAGLVDEAGKDIDQGRFARAVRTEQPEDRAAWHLEGDLVERAFAARIGFAEGVDDDG